MYELGVVGAGPVVVEFEGAGVAGWEVVVDGLSADVAGEVSGFAFGFEGPAFVFGVDIFGHGLAFG